jgi:hypothetical protein
VTSLAKTPAGSGGAGLAGSTNDPEIFSSGGTITQETVELAVTAPSPSSVAAGTTFAMTVALKDDQRRVDSSFNGNVTLAFTGPKGGTLGGTLTVMAQSGVAAFSGLTFNITGSYTITATSD